MTPAIVVLVAAVAVGAAAQRSTGIGFTLLVAPAAGLALAPATALGTLVRLAVVADLLVIAGERRRLDHRTLRAYLAPAALAVPVGLLVSTAVPPGALVATGAIATLFAAGALARTPAPAALVPATAGAAPRAGKRGARPRPATHAAGFAAGFFGVTTGMSGPPLALEAATSGRPLAGGRATMAVFFLLVDLAALAAHPHGAGAGLELVLLAALALGVLAGARVATRIGDARVRAALPWLVAAGACAALVRVVG